MAAASFAMIESQIKGDMEALKSVIGDSSRQASESAKDLKYVRDRQQMLRQLFGHICLCHFACKNLTYVLATGGRIVVMHQFAMCFGSGQGRTMLTSGWRSTAS